MGLPIIKTSGNGFLKSEERWQIKGVTYGSYEAAETSSDVLAKSSQCAIDAPLLKQLGANTVTVYYVDPTQDHDDCMQSFDDNEIYVIANLVNTNQTASNEGWDMSQYTRYTNVLDAMAGYNNLLGLLVGVETIQYNASGSDNENILAPSLKAAVRDMKAYTDARGYRTIPFGYFTDDELKIRQQLAEYLVCGGNSSETIDFFGLNTYAWCGDSTYTSSGYENYNSIFGALGVPIFISEEGCTAVQPRKFTDQPVIFGSKMSPNWSGAVIYEWHETGNQEVRITGYSLSKEWASCTINTTSPMTMTRPACPSQSSSYWTLDPSATLPTIAGLNIATVKAASVTATATSSGSFSAASAVSAASSSGESGLSAGAKAGIGIGVAAGVIIIAIAALWLYYRLKHRGKPGKAKQLERSEQPETAELPTSEARAELHGSGNIAEMYSGSTTHTHELQALGALERPHELDDSSVQPETNSTRESPSEAQPSSPSRAEAVNHDARDPQAALLGPFQPEQEGPPLDGSSQRSIRHLES
ncbi:hypothetical protein N7462_009713 [Penicillium macrosclerotiorum]|uniref:uncharacterized protein n=1 Tax=Penicillium macrosclerotiorum TaxID=303699 RepID=UPI0025480818|nr:uncharacterized protein N7462_009713 [Penicillium macrosclerotiorum]KAJ5674274.1 hypothetical protein N7462_009713 [Penicillium macrosclerotiorum]